MPRPARATGRSGLRRSTSPPLYPPSRSWSRLLHSAGRTFRSRLRPVRSCRRLTANLVDLENVDHLLHREVVALEVNVDATGELSVHVHLGGGVVAAGCGDVEVRRVFVFVLAVP